MPGVTASPSVYQRRRMTPADAARRAGRVKATRLVFLGGAALAILLLTGAVLSRSFQAAQIDTSGLVKGDQYVMDAPKFVGRTKSGTKLTVTGVRATRSVASAAGPVRLEKPRLETSDGSVATALTGVWLQSEQRLELEGDVVFARRAGEKATGSRAIWTTEPSLFSLDGGTQMALPSGETATAQALRWDEGRQTLTLTGDVKVTFKDGEATSQTAYFNNANRVLIGIGSTQIRSALGIGAADRYEYATVSRRLRMSGNVRATLR